MVREREGGIERERERERWSVCVSKRKLDSDCPIISDKKTEASFDTCQTLHSNHKVCWKKRRNIMVVTFRFWVSVLN
jgi:hypothetical protein